MAKRKQSSKRPQPKHKKQKKSRHDKRKRLQRRNPKRMDDSPTARFGRHVEGAGVHHNPTAGPADGEWLYGHNWVALAWLATHPLWGVIALPLQSMLYVREVDVPKLAEKHDWVYTLVELCCWDVEKSGLSNRSDRPWDNEDRRPSHADRRRSISREMLGKKFLAALPHTTDHRKLWTLFQDLVALAA